VILADGTQALASDGTPSDCVALALLGYFEKKIDLVVSGINSVANLGHDVTYSGTVTAAMEAVIWDIPAIAVSIDSKKNHLAGVDYAPAAQAAAEIVQAIQQHHLPAGVLLNVNVPYLPYNEIRGIRITRQGLRVYRDRLDARLDPRGEPYYWIGGDAPTGIPEDGTDFGALDEQFVSITPLQLDLTAYPAIHLLNTWQWKNQQTITADLSKGNGK